MVHKVHCSNCGASLRVTESNLGGKVLCPSCQSIVEVPTASEREQGSRERHRRKKGGARRRGPMVSSALGFLLMIVVATVAGWYSIHMSREHALRRYVFDPAHEVLANLVAAVESADGVSLDEFVADNLDEAKRQMLLMTVSKLKELEIRRRWRVNWDRLDPETGRKTYELEQVVLNREDGTRRFITMGLVGADGDLQLTYLKVEAQDVE